MQSVKKYNTFNDKIIKEIRELEAVCKAHDGLKGELFLETSLNFILEIPAIYLLYEDEKLVSFLTLFIPTFKEAEVSACTLPQHRQKGHFKTLLQEAAGELDKQGIQDMLLVCEPQSIDGMKAVKALNAELQFTEYLLKYKPHGIVNEPANKQGITLHKAVEEDKEELISLSCEVFNEGYAEAESLIARTLQSEGRVQYKAILGGRLIGMVSIGYDNGEASIYGFGLSPGFQGKGYGREILMLIVKELQHEGVENITIEVESTNEHAYNLYRKCGFQVETAFGYYRKKV